MTVFYKYAMRKLISKIKAKISCDYFTDVSLKSILGGTPNSRHSLIKRALRSGELFRLRRGCYVLSPEHRRSSLNLFPLAQMLYGPSYISLESALSHHGWIPEAVHAVTSVSEKRFKTIHTALGVFNYARVPSKLFFAGVSREISDSGPFLIASPIKALADYVYTNKLNWKNLTPVTQSLRVDPEKLKNIDFRLFDEVLRSASSVRVRIFIKGIKKELHL